MLLQSQGQIGPLLEFGQLRREQIIPRRWNGLNSPAWLLHTTTKDSSTNDILSLG